MSYLDRYKLYLGKFANSFTILESPDDVTISNGGIFDPISGDYHSINFDDLDLTGAKAEAEAEAGAEAGAEAEAEAEAGAKAYEKAKEDGTFKNAFICIEKELPNLRCTGLKILNKEQAAAQQKTDSLCEFVKISGSLINNDIIYTNESARFYDYFGAYIEPDMEQDDPLESQQYIRYTSGTIIDGDFNYHSIIEGKKSSIIKVPEQFTSSAVFGFIADSNGETPTPAFRSPEDSLDSFFPVAYIDVLRKTVTRLVREGDETVNFDFGEPE